MRFHTRPLIAAIALLCLLAGFTVFRPEVPEVSPQTIPAASSHSLVNSPKAEESPARPRSLPVIHATEQLPSSTRSPDPALAARTEMDLPAPPSGDFELTLTHDEIRAIIEKKYGGFFMSLGLPQERLDRLRTLLIERQQVTIDAANAALLFGLNPVRDLPAIQRGIEQFQSPVDAVLRNEFGDATFAAYRDFSRTIRERNLLGHFAGMLTAAQQTLEPAQEAQLVQILKKFPGPDSPPNFESLVHSGLNDRAQVSSQAFEAANAVLSPRQLELLRELSGK